MKTLDSFNDPRENASSDLDFCGRRRFSTTLQFGDRKLNQIGFMEKVRAAFADIIFRDAERFGYDKKLPARRDRATSLSANELSGDPELKSTTFAIHQNLVRFTGGVVQRIDYRLLVEGGFPK